MTTSEPTRAQSSKGPRVRVDELSVFLRRTSPEGVRMELKPPGFLTAAHAPVLPMFEGWIPTSDLVVRAAGLADRPFAAQMAFDGALHGELARAGEGDAEPGEPRPFFLELSVPLLRIASQANKNAALALQLDDGRMLRLLRLELSLLRGRGPAFTSLDLVDATEALLFDAPQRRLFDLQSPEEGFWAGTGIWRLLLKAGWARSEADPYSLDARPTSVEHRWQRSGDGSDLLHEDATRRQGGDTTSIELMFDTGHRDLGEVPPEGKDVPLDLILEHALTFGERACTLRWHGALPLRVRDPRPHLKAFSRLSAVGIDFGTSASVAALYQRGFRSLLRLGNPQSGSSAENPTCLLVDDHERLWSEMARAGESSRFPDLMRVVKASHAAREAMEQAPTAVVTELKSLPERVVYLDQSPQYRDRERQRDFLLDESRVRVLVRAYAYLLGRAINRPGQDVYLRYCLTSPAKFDDRSRALLEEEIEKGLRLSIPQGIDASHVTVSMEASEPEAFAAEVCPELAAHPALEPLVSRFGELRFAVFDFGGGTLDIACGRFRPATDEEQREHGGSTVIETLQVSGDNHLGGDDLTHELVWLTHQHPMHLPEMEAKEVPMMRPATIVANDLASKPHLYKRSLAGRQNRVRFERELRLEDVKHGPAHPPRKVDRLTAARLDGTEVELVSLGSDLPALHQVLGEHLESRIREGVKLLRAMLENTPWGGEGDWRSRGVVLLLAGNSSRSAFVEKALAEGLGIPDLKVFRPGGDAPFQQVVLYETPSRVERGTTLVGVTPKTAVALGALKIANREVRLVRRTQGFGYFLGTIRGFPPKFVALVPMGAPPVDATDEASFIDFGRWDAEAPLRVCREYEEGKMTSSDPRLSIVPTGLPAGERGRLRVCVIAPEEVILRLEREGQGAVESRVNFAKFLR
jgi:hypothetical protein